MTRLRRAAGRFTLRTGEPVEISLRAFQLRPDTPRRSEPLLAALARDHGGAAGVASTTEQLRRLGEAEGLTFDFAGAVTANTFDAHRLLTWAEATDGAAGQLALADQLWTAHFSEGADIADLDTLAARAGAAGLDLTRADEVLAGEDFSREVREQIAAADDLGIGSVPTFVLQNTWLVSGAQSQETFEQVLAEVQRAQTGPAAPGARPPSAS